ncbi:MAG TPA: NAD-dependent epimerase/dehydratase family protein [Actinomycetota bacterium]
MRVPMRAFLTGGTGFIGGRVARRLRDRGDEVVALVRSPERAADLGRIGCELVEGGLADGAALAKGLHGADACFHVAGDYRVGVTKAECQTMWETNVEGTRHVLQAAHDAGVARTVYVSTVGTFGNTGGVIVDETFRRDESKGYLSCYDETKYKAHLVAEEFAAGGDPVVIAMPGGVYGPGDHSALATLIEMARKGRLKWTPFADMGITAAHVDDIVEGIVLAHDRGRVGESYVLAGPAVRQIEIAGAAARLSGKKPPRGNLPTAVVKMAIPFGPLVGRAMGLEPNIREMIRSADGVTYWASADKAQRELRFTARSLEEGLRQTLSAGEPAA